MTAIAVISVGYSHTCAIVNGGVKCWGYNISGQVGNGTSGILVSSPVAVTGSPNSMTSV